MKELLKSLEKICTECYDYVLLDTSACGPPNSRPRTFEISMGTEKALKLLSSYCDTLEREKRLRYVSMLTQIVDRYGKIQTTEEVVSEIENGIGKLGNLLNKKAHTKRKNIKTYISAIKGLRNKLRERTIRFTEEETETMHAMMNEVYHLRIKYHLEPTDFGLLLTSINLAVCRGDTAMITCDRGLIKATVEAFQSLESRGTYNLDVYMRVKKDKGIYRFEPVAKERVFPAFSETESPPEHPEVLESV